MLLIYSILPGDRATVDGSQPPQTIVAHGQCGSYTGGHGVQAAAGKVVDIPFGICRTVYLPALPRQLAGEPFALPVQF